MRGPVSCYILFLLLMKVMLGTHVENSSCIQGWFGNHCQYKCRCLIKEGCNTTSGECLPDTDCEPSWFGPQCQYKDLAYNDEIPLTDGSDNTCSNATSLTELIDLKHNVLFTWMRLVANKEGLFAVVFVSFLSNKKSPVHPRYGLTRTIHPNGQILDLHGELLGRIRFVNVTFDTVKTRHSFCSVYVSGGRNVAIKQTVEESEPATGSVIYAVDGNLTKCSHSAELSTGTVNMTLNFSQPVMVNMYQLHRGEDETEKCRLCFFRLTSYNTSAFTGNNRAEEYQDQSESGQDVFTVYPTYQDKITGLSVSVSNSYMTEKYLNSTDGKVVLSMCELEVYGDVVCRQGQWGRDCENWCECPAFIFSCFPSTGACFTCEEDAWCTCPYGWFGEKCQFQCHCLFQRQCDKFSGECPGGLCEVHWFGPACQYWDEAYRKDSALTDGKDDTCLTKPYKRHVFPMTVNVEFTWMRLVTNQKGLFDNDKFNVTFLSETGSEIPPLRKLTTVNPNDKTLDIYGSLERRFRQIELTFKDEHVRNSFCSMYVSLGRNVALKQDTHQTSRWFDAYSYLAVDGNPSMFWSSRSCTHTDINYNRHSWVLTISRPVTVTLFKIYNRDERYTMCRLRYWRLETYNKDADVQKYDDLSPLALAMYIVYPNRRDVITALNISIGRFLWPENTPFKDCANRRKDNPAPLTLCEVQVFGEVECPYGTWGRECENVCGDCDHNKTCFVATGLCPLPKCSDCFEEQRKPCTLNLLHLIFNLKLKDPYCITDILLPLLLLMFLIIFATMVIVCNRKTEEKVVDLPEQPVQEVPSVPTQELQSAEDLSTALESSTDIQSKTLSAEPIKMGTGSKAPQSVDTGSEVKSVAGLYY